MEHKDARIGRMGHLAFADDNTGEIVIFGGSKAGTKYQSKTQRCLANDVVIYDYNTNKVTDVVAYSEASVQSRMYCSGFKIDSRIYSYGGLNKDGQLLSNFDELNYKTREHKEALVERGKDLLVKMHSAAFTGVFYKSKMTSQSNPGVHTFKLKNITGGLDWGETTNLIKIEGFYMFGGRKENNEASNSLLVFKVAEDIGQDRPKFKII